MYTDAWDQIIYLQPHCTGFSHLSFLRSLAETEKCLILGVACCVCTPLLEDGVSATEQGETGARVNSLRSTIG